MTTRIIPKSTMSKQTLNCAYGGYNELSVNLLLLSGGWSKDCDSNRYTIYMKEGLVLKVAKSAGDLVLTREYNAGLELNKACSPYLVRTYCYGAGFTDVCTRGNPFILQEKAPGISLLRRLRLENLPSADMNVILLQCFFILHELQSVERFTHYDLTGSNVILERISPTVFHFTVGDEVINLVSSYMPRFVAYSSCYLPRLCFGYAYVDPTRIGKAPGVMDVHIDFQRLCKSIRLNSTFNIPVSVVENTYYINVGQNLSSIPKFLNRTTIQVDSSVSQFTIPEIVEIARGYGGSAQVYFQEICKAVNTEWLKYRCHNLENRSHAIINFVNDMINRVSYTNGITVHKIISVLTV